MTALQQIVLAFLALVAILVCLKLTLRLLAKLHILPVLLYLVVGLAVFPAWVAQHSVAYYGILAALVLLVLASWLGPVVRDIRMERRAQQLLLDELKQAREEGHSISSFELHSGIPIAHYDE